MMTRQNCVENSTNNFSLNIYLRNHSKITLMRNLCLPYVNELFNRGDTLLQHNRKSASTSNRFRCLVFNVHVATKMLQHRSLVQSVLQLCGLQKLKILLQEFFVYKIVTRVDNYEAALRLFFIAFHKFHS